jgi:hypothetical protein
VGGDEWGGQLDRGGGVLEESATSGALPQAKSLFNSLLCLNKIHYKDKSFL